MQTHHICTDSIKIIHFFNLLRIASKDLGHWDKVYKYVIHKNKPLAVTKGAIARAHKTLPNI